MPKNSNATPVGPDVASGNDKGQTQSSAFQDALRQALALAAKKGRPIPPFLIEMARKRL